MRLMVMNWHTWEVIAKRHLWYRNLLVQRMAESEASIDACTDVDTLRDIVKLAERAERHQERMDRHMDRGLAGGPRTFARRSSPRLRSSLAEPKK